MTNAEKFEEIFGYAIDEFPIDPCDMIDHRVCANWGDSYSKCPIYNFWNKHYKKPKIENEN